MYGASRPLAGLLLLGIILATGCGSKDSENAAQIAPLGAPRDSTEVSVSVLDKAGYEQFLADQRGQVVLVDFWATWCPSCIEGFPDSVGLSRKYSEQGLVVASMALEDPEESEHVLAFLRQQEATMPNFISAYGGSDARSVEEFELSSGTIPTLKLYDRDGKLRHTFGGYSVVNFEEIEVAIRDLLQKG